MSEIVNRHSGGYAAVSALAVALDSAKVRELSALSGGLEDAASYPVRTISEEYLRDALARGEAALADPEYQSIVAKLKAGHGPASMDDIADEIGVLLRDAFPTREDLSGFVPLAAIEIASGSPSRLRLAMAFRTLRRTRKFRPSISEMLEALRDVSFHNVNALLKIRDRVEAVRQRLACGNFDKAESLPERRRGTLLAGPPDDLESIDEDGDA